MREHGLGTGAIIGIIVGVLVAIVVPIIAIVLLGGGGGGTPSSQLTFSPNIDSITYNKGLDSQGYYLTATITVSNKGNKSDSATACVDLGKLVDSDYGGVGSSTGWGVYFGTIQPDGTSTKTTEKLRPGWDQLATDQFYLKVEVCPAPGGSVVTYVEVGTLVV